jgi:hypothetical protein
VLRATIALFAASLMSFGASACGNSAVGPTSSAPPGNLVLRSEVDGPPEGSVKHAFLEYWSALQFQSWAEVASYYDPSFRDFAGTPSIIGAKKLNGPSYPDLKPSIVGVTRHSGLTTIKYTLWLSDGTKELASVTWQKVGGNWQIIYDSRLDAELSQFAENRVEIDQNGVLPTSLDQISPDAARAGSVATQSQARFLEQELDLRNP